MKKSRTVLIAAVIIATIAVVGFSYGTGSYNSMVGLAENVETAWSQVENQYQRRADLVPNLVNTVKGYAAHEHETLEAVVNARARVGSVNIAPNQLNAQTLQRFQAGQSELSNALSRLMVIMERYPDLKANENFRDLQAQLEGTENRIAVERKRFNEAANLYNTAIRSFPAVIFADIFDFGQRPYFAAESGAQKAPTVDFTKK